VFDNLGPIYLYLAILPLWFIVLGFIRYLAYNQWLCCLQKFVDPYRSAGTSFVNSYQRLLHVSFYEILISAGLSVFILNPSNKSDWAARILGYSGFVLVSILYLHSLVFVAVNSSELVEAASAYIVSWKSLSDKERKDRLI
jgi:hypothetical protein